MVAAFLSLAFVAAGAPEAFSERDVLGRWYRGDHLGYNLVLTLSRDHSYSAAWSGDEINEKTGDSVYGRASGRWKIVDDRLTIAPQNETKHTKGDLETMRIERHHGKIILAPMRSLKVPSVFHLDPMMVFERETR